MSNIFISTLESLRGEFNKLKIQLKLVALNFSQLLLFLQLTDTQSDKHDLTQNLLGRVRNDETRNHSVVFTCGVWIKYTNKKAVNNPPKKALVSLSDIPGLHVNSQTFPGNSI